jgi:hypothetical protein
VMVFRFFGLISLAWFLKILLNESLSQLESFCEVLSSSGCLDGELRLISIISGLTWSGGTSSV